MKVLLHIALLFTLLYGLTSCEEDVTLDMPQGEEQIVVEGQIEPGSPPIVMLTRTMPYFSSTAISDFSNMFVEGAVVKISDGTKTVDLIEINFKTLPDSLRDMLLDVLQLSADEIINFDYIIYTTPFMLGEVGKAYTLTVEKDQHHLSAVTTIPYLVVPDSIWSEPHDDPDNDSMFYYRFSIMDPPNIDNYYRIFTQRNNEPYYTNFFVSLMDDKLQKGKQMIIPLLRGDSKFAEIDPISFGAFTIGDTVTMKFCSIDAAHYDFWTTLSTDQFSGGPFASPVSIKSNVKGGLGIWGGYGAYYYTFIVK